jgi:ATP-dependent exoDNAse (exonuclease V) beta subunit
LLRQTLAPKTALTECALLFEHGDANWFQHISALEAQAFTPEPRSSERIRFRTANTERRRGLEHVAPSRREGQAQVPLDRLFIPSEGTGMTAGTLYHAWFALVGWLDDGMPTEANLRAAAAKIRNDLPADTWRDLDLLMANFREWLKHPEIAGVLRRTAYMNPQHPGFPSSLAPVWTKTIIPQKVEQERRFLVCDGTQFWNGSFDRIVWLGDGARIVAADVLDFKTDAIESANTAGFEQRRDHYRPQLEAYRRAVARLAQLPEECVAARLVFTFGARVMKI